MRPIKTENIGSNEPATKGDIEQLREDIHADIVQHVLSKEDGEKFATKEDLKEALKPYADRKELEGMFKASEERIIDALKNYHEEGLKELQGAHEDEMDTITEKKDAPPKWRSIPRRLKVAEVEIEKIKDKLPVK